MTYNPGMDGIRAVAVMMVMLFHANVPFFGGGFLGVDVFFVLSGYLISTLLIGELETTGRLDVKRFYIRRLMRLTPALLAMLIVYAAVAPLFWPEVTNHMAQVALSAAYLSDFSVAFWGTPVQLGHTWSLSVEEHFYLIWPLALMAAYRRLNPRQLLIALACAYVFSLAWRWVWLLQGQGWYQIWCRFDTHVSGLLLGACLALALRDPRLSALLERHSSRFLVLPLIAIGLLRSGWGTPWMLTWGVWLTEWASIAVLIAVHRRQGTCYEMLAAPALAWIGRLSYGLYLWHYPIFRYLRENYDWTIVLAIGAPLTLILAALSLYTIERWVLGVRDRMTSAAPALARNAAA
jgi:peptidoglycan/LPS O-acetylase OafA/YrhL